VDISNARAFFLCVVGAAEMIIAGGDDDDDDDDVRDDDGDQQHCLSPVFNTYTVRRVLLTGGNSSRSAGNTQCSGECRSVS